MKLTFKITNTPILVLDVDLSSQIVVTKYEGSPRAVKPIFEKGNFGYKGLERHMQYLMDDNRPLPTLLDDVKVNGLHVPFQKNLKLEVTD